MSRALVALAPLIVLAGCLVDVDFGGGAFRCDKTGECPAGQVCNESTGVCGVGDDAGIDANSDAGTTSLPVVAKHLIGDRLFLTFEDEQRFGVFRDSSGNRHDARHAFLDGGRVPGKFGLGIDPSVVRAILGDSPLLQPSDQGVTIEAWVSSTGGLPVIFGDPVDITGNGAPTATQMALYMGTILVGDEDRDALYFAVMDGCNGAVRTAAVEYTLGATHVAMTWDRASVRFYKNGVLEGSPQPLEAALCDTNRNYAVGRTLVNERQLSGYLDELKVSSYAKTPTEIVESMDFDSQAMGSDCGNLVHDLGEECDSDSMCCVGCRLAGPETTCGSGTCAAGVCQVTPGRSDQAVVVRYDFDAVVNNLIADNGPGPPLDLTVPIGASPLFKDGRMSLIDGTPDLRTAGPATKLFNAVTASNEVSIEVWVQPSNNTQGGPARIVTISPDTIERNITLAQTGESYIARIRSANTTLNGLPTSYTGDRVVTTAPTHVVFTRDASGNRRLWVNGVLNEQSFAPGALEWDAAYPIYIAGEGLGGRLFEGTLFLAAIYSEALDESRIAAHFLAGPE